MFGGILCMHLFAHLTFSTIAFVVVYAANSPRNSAMKLPGNIESSSSTNGRATHRDPYSPNASPISKEFDNAHLRKLGFKYNPRQKTAKEDVRHIRSHFIRAKMLHPDEEREIKVAGAKRIDEKDGNRLTRVSHWVGTGRSNAQFLDRNRERKLASERMRTVRQQQASISELKQTGEKPKIERRKRYHERMEFARSGNPDEPMKFQRTLTMRPDLQGVKEKRKEVYVDPKGRTKGQYIEEHRIRSRTQEKKARTRRLSRQKGKHSIIPTSAAPAPSTASPTRHSPSSSGTHWSDLSDIAILPEFD